VDLIEGQPWRPGRRRGRRLYPLSYSRPRGIIRSRLCHRGRRGEHAGCVAGQQATV